MQYKYNEKWVDTQDDFCAHDQNLVKFNLELLESVIFFFFFFLKSSSNLRGTYIKRNICNQTVNNQINWVILEKMHINWCMLTQSDTFRRKITTGWNMIFFTLFSWYFLYYTTQISIFECIMCFIWHFFTYVLTHFW